MLSQFDHSSDAPWLCKQVPLQMDIWHLDLKFYFIILVITTENISIPHEISNSQWKLHISFNEMEAFKLFKTINFYAKMILRNWQRNASGLAKNKLICRDMEKDDYKIQHIFIFGRPILFLKKCRFSQPFESYSKTLPLSSELVILYFISFG